jgi:hypothetical protein
MKEKIALSGAWYSIALVISTGLYSCYPVAPVTNSSKTPALYFASPAVVPVDDGHKLHTGVNYSGSIAINLWGYYRLPKRMYAGISYNRNGDDNRSLGGRIYDEEFRFRNHTVYSEVFGGYMFKGSRVFSAYTAGGYGWGKTSSTVWEYDNSVRFDYYGDYSKWFGMGGITFYSSAKKHKAFTFNFGLRGSWVRFSNYSYAASTYNNVSQFLLDYNYTMSVPFKLVTFRVGVNNHINGIEAANRDVDGKFGEWRRNKASLFIGIGFRLFKDKGR